MECRGPYFREQNGSIWRISRLGGGILKKSSFRFGKLFHLKKESIPPQAEPITPQSLLQIEIHPNDTQNELREKAAFLLSSYYAEAKIYRDHYVWVDIAQHLAFERNGQNNVSREDLVGLIEALKDPANEGGGGELDLKSKKFLLKIIAIINP